MEQAAVKKFLIKGFRVIGTVVPNDPVKIEIEDANFETVMVDLMKDDDAEKFVAAMVSKYENIEEVVLTVGGFALGKIADTKTGDIEKQYKLNFETAYNIARPAFAHMMEKKTGRIFLIGSRPGMNATDGKGMIAYGLAKSLLFRLAALMNEESKGTNVVTSVIVPSTIDTPPNRKSMPDADFDTWVKPEAIADVIYFYCTEEAAVLREPVIKVYNNS